MEGSILPVAAADLKDVPPTPIMTSPKESATAVATSSNGVLIRRMTVLAWRYRWQCVGILSVQVGMMMMTLTGLGLTGLAIDYFRHNKDVEAPPPEWWFGLAPPSSWPAITVVAIIALGIIVLALLRGFLTYLITVGTSDLVQKKVVVDLRRIVYDKLQRLSFRFFDGNESGSIINRLTSDVVNTSNFLSAVLFGLVNIAIAQVVFLIYMLTIHVKLTLAVMATMPVIAVITYIFKRLIRRDLDIYHKLNDKLILTLSENVQGVHVVKGFARQNDEIAKFARKNREVRDQQGRIFRWMSVFHPSVGFCTQINTMVVLAYGGFLVVAREADPQHAAGISLGAGLVVFAGLTSQFSQQISQLANIGSRAQEYLASAARVFEIIDTPLEIQSPKDAVRIRRARGAVKFESVTFGYKQSDEAVLKDVDFEVQPGQCVAILGPTGAGKSTLLSLISRFYDPVFGRVLIDGVDARRLDIDDLRRNVGLVFQESFLFSNTVAANIAFGHPDATRGQIESAARIACARGFITSLSDGYDTVIGERGVDLSGGQRQRLAIARAVLLEPSILILDDPTAAIDPETEHEILQAMDNAMASRTTFVVAHRMSTLRRADMVIVIDNGHVVQMGTHDELMNARGHYRSAADLQTADQETQQLLAALSISAA